MRRHIAVSVTLGSLLLSSSPEALPRPPSGASSAAGAAAPRPPGVRGGVFVSGEMPKMIASRASVHCGVRLPLTDMLAGKVLSAAGS